VFGDVFGAWVEARSSVCVVTPKKKPSRAAATRKCDELFSKIVRSVGYCVNCGSTSFLQCAHGFSRGYFATRWDDRNAFSFCRVCHVFYTHRPLEWDDWLHERWGDDLYDEIKALSLTHVKPDVFEVKAELALRWAELEAAA
jgi:hypothetical protein